MIMEKEILQGLTQLPSSEELYRLTIHPTAEIAIAEKPVFGAQLTILPQSLSNANYVATPSCLLGWLDHNRLAHLIIKPANLINPDKKECTGLTTRFFHSNDGTLRTTQPLKIHLLASCSEDIHKHGWMLFTPVKSAPR